MNSNQTKFELTNEFLINYGSTWPIDSIYMFLVAPIGLIGFVLNGLSTQVIKKIKTEKTVLYKYLEIYCLNSGNICFSAMFSIYSYAPRFVGFKYGMLNRILKCIVFNYGINMCIFVVFGA